MAEDSNWLATRRNPGHQDRFLQMPQSSGRHNFRFSDKGVRSVQEPRRLGIYSGALNCGALRQRCDTHGYNDAHSDSDARNARGRRRLVRVGPQLCRHAP
jgi:hypothetical protein